MDETLASFCETKHPAKWERKSEERGPKYKPEAQQPKVSHKWGKGTIYVRFKICTSRKKHIKEGKGNLRKDLITWLHR
jgi:hypothetical protein